MNLRIEKQKRKSLAMKITPDGIVTLIPDYLESGDEKVSRFIQEGLDKLRTELEFESPESLTRDNILDIVEEWSEKLNVEIKRVQIRVMKSKWGSCSSRGVLTVNRDVLQLPRELVEYVVCHELLHLRIPDHNKTFRSLMSSYIPDWQKRHKKLMLWMTNFKHTLT